ncbi:hypothetical protein HrrHc1_055 [Halorubrum phage Hardycor1]|nr:hypothetical protein HrrHc1_055 [Halorubrum phage Hardycor1]
MTVFATHNAEPAADDVRVETMRGREWLVAPVVLVREGVLNGGFVAYEELQKSAPGWNGRPVTTPPAPGTEAANLAPGDPSGHPIDGQTEDGRPNFASANETPFVEDMNAGLVLNVEPSSDLPTPGEEMSDRGLVGEAWIDLERAQDLGEYATESVERIAEGATLDVSTGYFHYPVEAQGEHNGERYEVAQTDLLPDHLALLPNERGACSWADGCGAPYPDGEQGGAAQASAAAASSGGASAPSFAAHVRDLVDESASECSPGPCSCGEHEGNESDDEDGHEDGDGGDTTTNTDMNDNQIQALATKTAFDLETLREWGDDRLSALAETVEANDDGDGATDDDGSDGGTTDGDAATDGGDPADDDDDADDAANADLRERVERLESVNADLRERFEAERSEKRERLAETVAAHTDHTASDLAENTDEFPDAALESMADALGDDGRDAQGHAAPQGNRVNYLAQGGATEDPNGGIDTEGYTDAVGALSTLTEREQAGD